MRYRSYLQKNRLKMETHIHKQQLAEIQARRIMRLEELAKGNEFIKQHLQRYYEKHDKERHIRENQQNQC